VVPIVKGTEFETHTNLLAQGKSLVIQNGLSNTAAPNRVMQNANCYLAIGEAGLKDEKEIAFYMTLPSEKASPKQPTSSSDIPSLDYKSVCL
jgi:hypothetical protein